MWSVQLKINNNITKREDTISFEMDNIYRYSNLYQKLPDLLKKIGYKNCRYRPSQINFYFLYFNKLIFVDNWDKYLLNRDKILININHNPIVYKLIDSFSGKTIFHSNDKKNIYEFYEKIKFTLKQPILIKGDNCLLDVLDKGENYLNDCINRLIHKYNY